jgi:TPR repeat protein
MIICLRNLLLSGCWVLVILLAVIIPVTTTYAQEITATGELEAQFDGVIADKYLSKPRSNEDSSNQDAAKNASPTFDGKIDNGDISAIQLYSQDELIRLINQNIHLQRVQADRCQLVRDIQARAEILTIPSYQFLWGDMLAWGICVNRDAELGIDYMRLAATQGLPAAFEHLGRYHANGILVTQDTPLAVRYFKEAAALGSKPALLQLADLLIAGHGSPYDYENVYVWLYQTVSADKSYRTKISTRMDALEQKMSPSVIKSARTVMRQY